MSKNQEGEPANKRLKLCDDDEFEGLQMTRALFKMRQSYDPDQPSPFSKLPVEMIEHIFAFVDEPTLMSLTFVDHHMNQVIATSPKLMDKIPFTTGRYDVDFFIKKFSRKYRKIVLSRLNAAKKKILVKNPYILRNAKVMEMQGSEEMKWLLFDSNLFDAGSSSMETLILNTSDIEVDWGTIINRNPKLKCIEINQHILPLGALVNLAVAAKDLMVIKVNVSISFPFLQARDFRNRSKGVLKVEFNGKVTTYIGNHCSLVKQFKATRM